ncbi:site-specific integrase [Microtetraspora malaysiensis]|uniref:site-specific integrase n=1 Tax=Microtetraspora malaysiensis TaxID=161358 RepID=UPI003D930236
MENDAEALARIEPTGRPPAVLGHAPTDLAVSESTRARIRDGVAANTRRAYGRQWQMFTDWCHAVGRCPLPATAETLAEYVNALCDRDQAPASIEQAIAAVRTMHRHAGHKGHPDTEAARIALRGYRRERVADGKRNQRQALPVIIETLRGMVRVCDLSTTIGVRDRLVLVLGLALMGRRSELVALDIADVREVPDGLEITIRTSKTDKDSRGEVVAIPRGSHPLTDPVKVLRDWRAVLRKEGITSGRLLRSVSRYGHIRESLGAGAVTDVVRKLAVAADVPNADQYTAHSLRAGGATVAYAAGVPVSVIARHGRWAPNSPVLLSYIRAVDMWKDNAMRNVGL